MIVTEQSHGNNGVDRPARLSRACCQYAHLCKFCERCQDALTLANKNEAICQSEIEKTLKGTAIREGISSVYIL